MHPTSCSSSPDFRLKRIGHGESFRLSVLRLVKPLSQQIVVSDDMAFSTPFFFLGRSKPGPVHSEMYGKCTGVSIDLYGDAYGFLAITHACSYDVFLYIPGLNEK